ncbi:accessory Sec system S-layer assembly protein [Neobacillus piezotolerans]|uniref:Accessory Sec system S-layer assembly protein n=1 Tax=Neobacillus piezotolerans TaxID=2259171 RepID=A0A3D8GT02_9BACI|nr:accessory Sec system S-layer assembly protein [Neobacillus piezotolerans]RDU37568.1 accessory Sec system S-layer assembly protein [Neobacillus piezotolerans]
MALFGKKEEETEITSNSVTEEAAGTNGDEEFVETSLVFHPDWELTNSERYVYMFQHKQLPALKPNQISIKGIKLLNYNDGFVVVAFLRNSLDKPIRFEAIDLILLDGEGQAVAKRNFSLDTIGEIPARSSMPWRFLFEEGDKLGETIPEEGWSIAFEIKQHDASHKLDLAPSWEEQLAPAQKEQLENIVAGLPKLGPNEINVVGLEAKFLNEGKLAVTLLIRNGSQKELQFEQIPLAVEDASGEAVAKGGFKLDDFKVKPNSARPWTFVFPKELILKENPDLSSWKVFMPNQGQ